jgi:hypothetical protein
LHFRKSLASAAGRTLALAAMRGPDFKKSCLMLFDFAMFFLVSV